MSFSRLLLVAANSQKFIRGEGNDKVCITPPKGREVYEGEVILCFQLDDRTDRRKRVARSLGILDNNKRCDGLVFFSQDEKADRVICLVEMKSTNVTNAEWQLTSTKEHIEKLLFEECSSLPEECQTDCQKQIAHIVWKACLYHSCSSQNETWALLRKLIDKGFDHVDRLDRNHNDLRPLLIGKGIGAEEIGKKFKSGRKH